MKTFFFLCRSFVLSAGLAGTLVHAQIPPPPAATQAEVNAGTVSRKYVSPATLAGWTGAGTNSGALTVVQQTNLFNAVTNQDTRNLTLKGGDVFTQYVTDLGGGLNLFGATNTTGAAFFTGYSQVGGDYYALPGVQWTSYYSNHLSHATATNTAGLFLWAATNLFRFTYGYDVELYNLNVDGAVNGSGAGLTQIPILGQNLTGIFTNVTFFYTNTTTILYTTNGGNLAVWFGTNNFGGGGGGGGLSNPLTVNLDGGNHYLSNFVNMISGNLTILNGALNFNGIAGVNGGSAVYVDGSQSLYWNSGASTDSAHGALVIAGGPYARIAANNSGSGGNSVELDTAKSGVWESTQKIGALAGYQFGNTNGATGLFNFPTNSGQTHGITLQFSGGILTSNSTF